MKKGKIIAGIIVGVFAFIGVGSLFGEDTKEPDKKPVTIEKEEITQEEEKEKPLLVIDENFRANLAEFSRANGEFTSAISLATADGKITGKEKATVIATLKAVILADENIEKSNEKTGDTELKEHIQNFVTNNKNGCTLAIKGIESDNLVTINKATELINLGNEHLNKGTRRLQQILKSYM